MHGCLSSDSTACNTKLIFLIFSWKKYPISCYVLNEAFTRINSPLFKWQFSCCYPKKWRILQTCFTRFLVDKLRQFREFHTWKIITSLKHKIKKCIYIKIYIYIYIYSFLYSFFLPTKILDLSGKILFQLRNSQLTMSFNVHLINN